MRLNYIDNIDCMEGMIGIPAGSVDLIVTDPPYGTMRGAALDGWSDETTRWDERVETARLFSEFQRVLREGGTCVVFSQEPLTSELRKQKTLGFAFAYPMVWEKDHFANALIAKKAPVSYFEDISVFYKEYDRQNANPLREYSAALFGWIGCSKKMIIGRVGQRADHFFRAESMQFKLCTPETYDALIDAYGIDRWAGFRSYAELQAIDAKYKRVFNLPAGAKTKSNILAYKKDYQGLHPTQKPVALIEDLVLTYSNHGDVVLDPFMGSGTTAAACVRTGRHYIGFELAEKYHKVALDRIRAATENKEGAAL